MASRLHPIALARQQAGVSLIEVLVSIVLLSFGIVGLAGLQLHGSRFNHSAYLSSQATNLAYDIADRMRANLAAANLPAARLPASAYVTEFAALFDPASGPACDAVLGAASAARDVNQWKSCLELALPLGQGRVSELNPGVDYTDACGVLHAAHSHPAGLFVIEITWSRLRIQNEDDLARNPNRLECVVLRTEVGPT